MTSDDEYLTAEGQMAQPRDHQVVMAGFHYISKIFLRGYIIDQIWLWADG
jgi:hypothetical protein